MLSPAERRFVARKAARASAIKRRAMADPARRRVKQRELALNFRVRLVDRAEFERRDTARRLRAGIGPNERGTETLWQEYRSCARAFKAQGQGFCTTNGQRAAALRNAGHPRCGRTVQRAHASLAEMGLLRRFHDRRGGSRAGNRDRLRVQFAPSFVTPPSAAPAAGLRPAAAGASRAVGPQVSAARGGPGGGPAPPVPVARPDGRRSGSPAAPAEQQHREREAPNACAGREAVAEDPESLRRAQRLQEARERVSRFLVDRRGDRR